MEATLARVQLASLPAGTIVQGATYVAAVGATAFVYTHGTTTQVNVWSLEVGGVALTQPVTADTNGQLPGWVDSLQTLDVTATFHGNTKTLEATPLSVASLGGSVITSTTQPGTAYTFALVDLATVVRFSNAAPVVVTVPPNSTVAFPVGAVIEVFQAGIGPVTLVPGAGVTLQSAGGFVAVAGQYATVGLRQDATDVWVVSGNLVGAAPAPVTPPVIS